MSFGVGYVVVMLSLVCRALVPSLARWAACLALAPLAGCLALIPDLNRLTLVSVFGLFVTVVGVVGLSGGYALTSDAFEVHLWGSAGPGTPSCSWGVLIRHVGSILYSVESVNHVMPNADMMADPTRLPRVIAIVMVSYWLFVGAWVALTDMAGFGKCPGGGAIVIDCLPAGPPRDVLKVAVCLQLLASLPITMFPAVEMLERRAVPVADDDDGKPDHSLNAPLLDRELSADLTDTTRPSYVSTVSASTVPSSAGGMSSAGPPSPPASPAAAPSPAAAARKRALLRVACYELVVFLGLVVPNFQVFTGLVGCLFLSLLGFILPVVLFETSASGHRGENAPLRSLAHVLIAVLGVILAIVGTGTSIVALRGGAMKALIVESGMSHADCVEKAELRAKCREALARRAAAEETAPSPEETSPDALDLDAATISRSVDRTETWQGAKPPEGGGHVGFGLDPDGSVMVVEAKECMARSRLYLYGRQVLSLNGEPLGPFARGEDVAAEEHRFKEYPLTIAFSAPRESYTGAPTAAARAWLATIEGLIARGADPSELGTTIMVQPVALVHGADGAEADLRADLATIGLGMSKLVARARAVAEDPSLVIGVWDEKHLLFLAGLVSETAFGVAKLTAAGRADLAGLVARIAPRLLRSPAGLEKLGDLNPPFQALTAQDAAARAAVRGCFSDDDLETLRFGGNPQTKMLHALVTCPEQELLTVLCGERRRGWVVVVSGCEGIFSLEALLSPIVDEPPADGAAPRLSEAQLACVRGGPGAPERLEGQPWTRGFRLYQPIAVQ
ncbi:hypothetical protein AURANDRAFT_62554 [Aureococcus anophagefferens]|uniref:Uncharacterized protein AOT13 n=1 Tax=Aureococcus anophagefferens TaxID=44056 RepID=F0Y3Z5_AURAN|nr:hypothetical protein AURANDRAFT_62554 [Aureococcus anophagefferens]EGB10037.1 hypothetical protein AURANDRAFT_62554 [Aureococcus anophagefferens]|eukprot:XP_009034879.1 hypothetical protein AURANDRAFT_62554 [Aureococcus anophagefferens]